MDVVVPKFDQMKLDLACGQRCREGFDGVDISPLVGARYVHDLTTRWPDTWVGAVEEARCSHFFEHLTPAQRCHFMNELWLALVPGGECEFTTPLGAWRQMQDPDHKWPPLVPGSWSYYSVRWLEANKLGHYRELFDIRCNFEVVKGPHAGLLSTQWENLTEARRQEMMVMHPDAQTDLVVRVRRVP